MRITLTVLLLVYTSLGWSQSDSLVQTKKHTSLEEHINIEIWGAEPGWKVTFLDNQLSGYLPNVKDSCSFLLQERISNMGFTNEYVDTYTFQAESGEQLVLILVKEDQCKCVYDMREGESNTRAYVLIEMGEEKRMLLGCARIDEQ